MARHSDGAPKGTTKKAGKGADGRVECILVGRVVRFDDQTVALPNATIRGHGLTVAAGEDGSFVFPLDGLPFPARITITVPGFFALTEDVDWSQIVSGGLLFRDFPMLEATGSDARLRPSQPSARQEPSLSPQEQDTTRRRPSPAPGAPSPSRNEVALEGEREKKAAEEPLPPVERRLRKVPPSSRGPRDSVQQSSQRPVETGGVPLTVPDLPRSSQESFVSLDGLAPVPADEPEEVAEAMLSLSEDSRGGMDTAASSRDSGHQVPSTVAASIQTIEHLENLSWETGEGDFEHLIDSSRPGTGRPVKTSRPPHAVRRGAGGEDRGYEEVTYPDFEDAFEDDFEDAFEDALEGGFDDEFELPWDDSDLTPTEADAALTPVSRQPDEQQRHDEREKTPDSEHSFS